MPKIPKSEIEYVYGLPRQDKNISLGLAQKKIERFNEPKSIKLIVIYVYVQNDFEQW